MRTLDKLTEPELEALLTLRARGYTAAMCIEHFYQGFPEAYRYANTTIEVYLYQPETRDLTQTIRDKLAEEAKKTSFGLAGSRVAALTNLAEGILQNLDPNLGELTVTQRKGYTELFIKIMDAIRVETKEDKTSKPKSPLEKLLTEAERLETTDNAN